jgi:hypothetical protein
MATSSTGKRFPRKLSGAQARLFAEGCMHYMSAANDACNDTPDEYPIFSWLSPEQRISLVSQVAVGLLCPGEPLPPETIQHFAAYLGVVACIKIELEIEMDDVYMREVGEDFLDLYYEPYAAVEENERGARRFTEDEQTQRGADMALIGRAAEKNKKKLDKKSGDQEEFSAGDRKINYEEELSKVQTTTSKLFSGGPCSEENRRPPRPLTDAEKCYGFQWRLLCDAAFQEDKPDLASLSDVESVMMLTLIPPLSNVNFCWNCYDPDKWHMAIDILMHTKFGSSYSNTERALLIGTINDFSYADLSQHARIRAVEKTVKDIRDSYDPYWEFDKSFKEQRLIFAVCTSELFGDPTELKFIRTFESKCQERGIDLLDADKYQERLEIYRSIKDDFIEGLDRIGPGTPADYKADTGLMFGGSCGAYMCWNSEPEKLQRCSKCLVVSYCSKECQRKDWPNHKKVCKNLAIFRKDKEQLKKVLKEF